MNISGLPHAAWRTSKRSQQNGACVAVAHLPRMVAVRDSKNPTGPILTLAFADWHRLVHQIKSDQHRPA
ncbi:DUF397 domain-containing protein [Actinomadura gamaensis]|uniref:DUF397 domain-containing protein n=1 Tax=Actinomadura gamaensis TaxID=1763541 RepID=A0ABV9TU66_9ACTN